MTNAATILEPWLNHDPCEECEECERICLKMQKRIDGALAIGRAENERLRATISDLASGVDYYEEVLRLRQALVQYRDDLLHPPSADSRQRRIKMVEGLLS